MYDNITAQRIFQLIIIITYYYEHRGWSTVTDKLEYLWQIIIQSLPSHQYSVDKRMNSNVICITQ